MTQDIRTHLSELMRTALISLAPDHADTAITLERPKQLTHGDFSCNLAMQLARSMKRNPRELAQLLVESLNLEEVEAGAIDPEAPLFNAGLGLDSIDALELALAVSKRYGFQLRSDNDENRQIFASLRALSAHIEQHRTT